MYKSVFEQATDGMILFDGKRFIDCNDAILKMLMYDSKEDLLGMGPADISPEFQADGRCSSEKSDEMIAKTLKDGSNTFEWIHMRANGENVWVEVSITKIIQNDEIIFLAVWRDIAEKKALEEELKIIQESENQKLNERVELALLGNNDGVWDWNIITNEVYYSPRWKEMLGYENDELPSDFSSWKNNLHPDEVQNNFEYIEEHMESKNAYFELTHRLKHKNGTWVWILARGKKILDEDGNVLRMIGTHTDISAQKKVEQELRDSKQYFKAIYDGSLDAIAILDEESHFLEVNPAYIKMTGMSEEKLLSTSCIALSAPEDVERSIAIINEVMSVGYVKNYEKRCNFTNNNPIDVSMSLSLLQNPIRILISVSDVTQQKDR
ncbi:MAG: PAS domain S-box protein [Sulfurimonas sp.]|nr:PAS domain S-box protein [Sulfurimonas sp.]